jgi:large subunit ribosomal protein L9
MEIILKKDVENLGFTDDIVKVKNGYGRNYLIPQGFGILATDSAKKVLAENLRQRAHKESKLVEDAQTQANKLKELSVQLTAKVGQGNKLFGSLSNSDLALELGRQGIQIDKKFIQIPGSVIKTMGRYIAKVRFHRDVQAELEFEVVAEKNAS